MTIPLIKTASRVFEVLEHFRDIRRPQRLRDIVSRLAYPTSSTAALLKSMVELGYLAFDNVSRSYVPTARVAMLGSWINDPGYARDAALAWMQQVNDATGETILLGVQHGGEAVYAEVIRSVLPIQYFVEPGTRRPMTGCGVGWAMLSQQPDAAARALLRPGRGAGAARRAHELNAQLETVRRDGYAFSRHSVTAGVGVIALPVARPVLGQPVALAVGGPVERLEARLDLILDALRKPPPQISAPP